MRVQRFMEFDSFFCDICRKYVYDELSGDGARGIPARTRVDDLPESWSCPVCGSEKGKLRACTLLDQFSNADGVVERLRHRLLLSRSSR